MIKILRDERWQKLRKNHLVALGYCQYCYRRVLGLGVDLNQACWIYRQEYEAIGRTQKELAEFCII